MKKVFQPAFGYAQHPKASQNSQHLTPYSNIFLTSLVPLKVTILKKKYWIQKPGHETNKNLKLPNYGSDLT